MCVKAFSSLSLKIFFEPGPTFSISSEEGFSLSSNNARISTMSIVVHNGGQLNERLDYD